MATLTEALDTELPMRTILELIDAVRGVKPRDPLRMLQDQLLDTVNRLVAETGGEG